jgi:hypothetical protein
MAPRPTPPDPPPAPAKKFRAAIEQARQDGVDDSALLLRLTLGDLSRLKRDREIASDEISFTGGEMRYLGVKVVGGDVTTSALVILHS